MRQPPGFEKTTRLVARALQVPADDLVSGFGPAVPADLEGIVAFRARNFDELISGDDRLYLQWRYRFGRSEGGMGELWVLKIGGAILGIVGTEDITCSVSGRRLSGARTMDILVARERQNSGLGVWLNQAVFRLAPFTIAIGANRNSAGTVGRLFHQMPPLIEWRMLFNAADAVKRRIPIPALAHLLGALFGGVLSVLRTASALTSDRSLSLRPLDRIDDKAVRLFENDGNNAATVLRTPAFLNYRLFDNPRGRYSVTGAWRDEALVGLVAWRVVRNGNAGSAMHIIDIRADATRPGPILRKLLLYLGRQAESAGCSHVSLMMHAPQSEPALWMSGFLAARHNQKVFGLYADDPAVMAELSAAAWSLTDLCDDNDGS